MKVRHVKICLNSLPPFSIIIPYIDLYRLGSNDPSAQVEVIAARTCVVLQGVSLLTLAAEYFQGELALYTP